MITRVTLLIGSFCRFVRCPAQMFLPSFVILELACAIAVGLPPTSPSLYRRAQALLPLASRYSTFQHLDIPHDRQQQSTATETHMHIAKATTVIGPRHYQATLAA